MKKLTVENLEGLFEQQLADWPQAHNNYKALGKVLKKDLDVNGFKTQVQFNAARIVSSAAKVDAKSIRERKCFLCQENQPPVQKGLEFTGLRSHNEYRVLINPFPIFPKHLTIPDINHVDQLISGRMIDMLELADVLQEYVIFYNGPLCGASAPDHFHFQAGNKGFLPVEREYDSLSKEMKFTDRHSNIFLMNTFLQGAFIIESNSIQDANDIFEKILKELDLKKGEKEPMINLLAWKNNDLWRVVLFMRRKHRPSCYFLEGDENILLSPASVDLGGVFITPLEKDFNKITSEDLEKIVEEVCVEEKDVERIVKRLYNVLK